MPSSSSSALPPTPSPRRTHHKRRSSALRLAADTMTSLPAYVPAARYHHLGSMHDQDPLDQPPDYPDSAEEADEDTDTDATANNNNSFFYVPHTPTSPGRPHTTSPRRQKRFMPTHKRRPSFQPNPPTTSDPEPPPDPYLDALLARSVHALEMSNTLLQNSMSTQSSLSTLLADNSQGDAGLDNAARGLSTRIRDTWDGRATWANDLEAITRDVEGLFDEEGGEGNRTAGMAIRPRQAHLREASAGVSSSLPVESGMAAFSRQRRPLRRPSLELRESPVSGDAENSNWPSEATPRLVLSQQHRSNLIAPPPRAITQYVASTQGTDAILLPSTLGLRSPPSFHPAPTSDGRSFYNMTSSSTASLISTPSSLPPQLTDRAPEPATPAYNMLASFVSRPSSGSNTPSTSFTHSFMRRRGSASTTASNSTERGTGTRRRTSLSPSPSLSSVSSAQRRSRSQTPRAVDVRPMTPFAEESSPSPSSSDSCLAKRTVQSLRKILDEQPPPPAKAPVSQGLRAPAFMPRTPAPAPHAGTSTATASVSRLFTKGTHSSSTRAPSPPRQSAMKRSAASSVQASRAGTPTMPSTPILSEPTSSLSPAPAAMPSGSYTSKRPPPLTASTLSIPEFVGRVLKGSPNSSAPNSGRSTPSTSKRISFAALPESYAASRPPDPKFKDKAAARKRRRKARSGGGSSSNANDDGEGEEGGSWSAWLGGGLGLGGMGFGASGSGLGGMAAARHEEKMEDRMTRNWGRMSGGGGLDEWAV